MRTSAITPEIESSAFIWNASKATCHPYIWIAKPILEKTTSSRLSSSKAWGPSTGTTSRIGLVRFNYETILKAAGQEAKLLVMATDKQISSTSLSFPSHPQSFTTPAKKSCPRISTSMTELPVSKPSLKQSRFPSMVFLIPHCKNRKPPRYRASQSFCSNWTSCEFSLTMQITGGSSGSGRTKPGKSTRCGNFVFLFKFYVFVNYNHQATSNYYLSRQAKVVYASRDYFVAGSRLIRSLSQAEHQGTPR